MYMYHALQTLLKLWVLALNLPCNYMVNLGPKLIIHWIGLTFVQNIQETLKKDGNID